MIHAAPGHYHLEVKLHSVGGGQKEEKKKSFRVETGKYKI